MYSAGYRQTALDRLGPDDPWPTSVYTRVLINKLKLEGTPIAQIARDVRKEVRALARTVGHDQRPAYYDELSANLVLKQAPKAPEAPRVREAAAPQPETQRSTDKLTAGELLTLDLAYWTAVKDATDPEELRSYIKQYPQGRFVFLATVRLRNLENLLKNQPKVSTFVPKQTEEETEDRADPDIGDQPVLSPRELAQSVQRELKRLGCDPGAPDGAWGRNSKRALRAFLRRQNRRIASLDPTPQLLNELEGKNGRVCPLVCGPRQEVKGNRCVAKQSTGASKREARKRRETRKRQEARKRQQTRSKRQRAARVARVSKPKVSARSCGRCMRSKWSSEFFHLCGAAYARSRSQRLCK